MMLNITVENPCRILQPVPAQLMVAYTTTAQLPGRKMISDHKRRTYAA
jgi:hypothetical protein